MGSNVSSAPFGHVQSRQKSTEAPNIQKYLLAVRKMMISMVKNGRLHYFFSPILLLTLLDTTLQGSLLPLVSFFH